MASILLLSASLRRAAASRSNSSGTIWCAVTSPQGFKAAEAAGRFDPPVSRSSRSLADDGKVVEGLVEIVPEATVPPATSAKPSRA